MLKLIPYIATILLASVPAFALQAAAAQIDFHHASKMMHKEHGPVDRAYGLMTLTTDSNGKGMINIMFSNRSRIDGARFNARVTFLDTSGAVIKQEHFARRIAAAGLSGAVEGKVSKPLSLSNFDSIRVDFFLSDIPRQTLTEPAYQNTGFISVVEDR